MAWKSGREGLYLNMKESEIERREGREWGAENTKEIERKTSCNEMEGCVNGIYSEILTLQ